MTLKSILIVLGIVLIAFAVTYFQDSKFREKESLYEKHENELVTRNLLLQKQLGTSERKRLVLGTRFDSLNRINSNLVRLSTKLDSAYKSVKGSYSKRTVTELETEMIKRARQVN